jgi:hypothetical protein
MSAAPEPKVDLRAAAGELQLSLAFRRCRPWTPGTGRTLSFSLCAATPAEKRGRDDGVLALHVIVAGYLARRNPDNAYP